MRSVKMNMRKKERKKKYCSIYVKKSKKTTTDRAVCEIEMENKV